MFLFLSAARKMPHVKRLLPGLAILALTGCVDRIISIRSDPPGAQAWLDGEPVGRTPVDVPYVWYGTRELMLTKEGCGSERRMVTFSAPWWQIFPFDFVTDVLLPVTLTDRTTVNFVLQPQVHDDAVVDEIRRRAAEAREKALK